MDELKIKQKKTKKILTIITIILSVVGVFLLFGSGVFYFKYAESSNSKVPYYGDGPVSGWASLVSAFELVGLVLLYLFAFLATGGLFIVIIIAIAVMWIVYAIYYKKKFAALNVINK